MRRSLLATVIIAVLIGTASPATAASPGDRDPFFGHDGIQTAFANGAVASALAVDHHGRVVLAGYTTANHPDIALARFTPAGALDPTFGIGGRIVTDLGANDYAFDVAIQSDGGIVIAGERASGAADRVVVQRYRPSGTLDPTFGTDGTVLTGFGRRYQSANALAIGSSGRIVVAGSTSNGITARSAIARYLLDGRLDDSFGGHGRVTTDISRSAEQFTDVHVDAEGRVIATGWAEGSLVPAYSAARYLRDGSLDPTFDGDGIARVDVSGGADRSFGSAVQPDGHVVLVGAAAGEWGIVRLGPRGHLDPTFSEGGRLVTAFGSRYDEADAVVIQGNGKLVVAGRIRIAAKDDLGILRLKPGGRHDLAFGAGGRVVTDVAGGTDAAHDVAVQPNGKLVLAGEATIDRIRRFVAVRYLSS